MSYDCFCVFQYVAILGSPFSDPTSMGVWVWTIKKRIGYAKKRVRYLIGEPLLPIGWWTGGQIERERVCLKHRQSSAPPHVALFGFGENEPNQFS